jgi:hypothetical protein
MEQLRLCSVFSLWGAGARDSNSQKVEMCMGVSGGCESEELVLHTSETIRSISTLLSEFKCPQGWDDSTLTRSASQSDSASSDLHNQRLIIVACEVALL